MSAEASPVGKARRLLPLYDATAAIACNIGDDEIVDRIAIVAPLRAAMTSIERFARTSPSPICRECCSR